MPKQKTRYITLHTPRGPVRYADSGWSESEWRVIQSALGRRVEPGTAAPAAPRPQERFIDWTQVR